MLCLGLGSMTRDAVYDTLGYEYEYGPAHQLTSDAIDYASMVTPVGVAKKVGKEVAKEAIEQGVKHADEVKDALKVKKGKPQSHIKAGDLKNISPNELKKAGINPHEFKREHIGKEVSEFEIRVAPDGELVIVPRHPSAKIPPNPTGVYIKRK